MTLCFWRKFAPLFPQDYFFNNWIRSLNLIWYVKFFATICTSFPRTTRFYMIHYVFNFRTTNPFMPTVPTFAFLETDISRHNGGTWGAPLKPFRDDSALIVFLTSGLQRSAGLLQEGYPHLAQVPRHCPAGIGTLLRQGTDCAFWFFIKVCIRLAEDYHCYVKVWIEHFDMIMLPKVIIDFRSILICSV